MKMYLPFHFLLFCAVFYLFTNNIVPLEIKLTVLSFKVCLKFVVVEKLLFVSEMLRKTAQLLAINVLQPRRNINSPLKLLRYQSNSANLIYDQYLQ